MFDSFIKKVLERRNEYLTQSFEWRTRHGPWFGFSTNWTWFDEFDKALLSRMMSGLVAAGLLRRRRSRRHFKFTSIGIRLLEAIEHAQRPVRTWIFPKVVNELTCFLVDQGVKFPLVGADGFEALKPWLGAICLRYNLRSAAEVGALLDKSFRLIKSRDLDHDNWRVTLRDDQLEELIGHAKEKILAHEAGLRFDQIVEKLGLTALFPLVLSERDSTRFHEIIEQTTPNEALQQAAMRFREM